MKHLSLLIFIVSGVFAQSLPDVWSQSYCTFDIATTPNAGSYAIGFGVDNFALYGSADSTAYDTRRFDIFAQYGVAHRFTLELKFSYPTSGVLAGKINLTDYPFDIAVKIGIGYMKGTRIGHITDYVFDFYPTLLFSKKIIKNIHLFYAPKIIYSIHPRDRQEHSHREPRTIFQYGHGMGVAIGCGFKWIIEGNWLFADNEGVTYTVNQFGLGVHLPIK